MKMKLTVGKTIAGLLIIAGMFSLFKACQFRQEADQRTQTPAIDIPVDFSKPGEYTAPFKQTGHGCHRQTLNLHVQTNSLAEIQPSKLRAIFDLKWQITDSKGKVLMFDGFSNGSILQDIIDGDTINICSFSPLCIGEYTFSCTVVNGVPGLAGLDQRLVCNPRPCALEYLPAIIGQLIGLILLVIAGIILLVSWFLTRRKRKRLAITNSDVPSEDEPSDGH